MEKAKILLVEDDLVLAQSIEAKLRQLGYGVTGRAKCGTEAIQKTADDQPNLVLMDIMLEGEMDGIEAADEIRNLYDVPVVYMTACEDERTLQRAKITQPFGYLVKPFKARDLVSAIEVSIYKHSMEKERERLITELQEALYQVKTLRGLLPICMHCKSIRDDQGYWQQIELYVEQHSEVDFSHGLCPECAKTYYPEVFADIGLDDLQMQAHEQQAA